MKLALLHYSFWPALGGVEQVMRDQANMLVQEGHTVKIICGVGANPGEPYDVEVLPELAPDFPLYAQVASVLEHGQADLNFGRYRTLLVEVMRRALSGVDLTLVHNVFTMHHNLALTRALQDLAAQTRLVAWTHDLVATNTDYALPNPGQPPWNLMRTGCPHAPYVAVSEARAREIREQLKPAVAPQVIPDLCDPMRLFGLTPEMVASYGSLDLSVRDFIFLLPAQVMPRKRIDFAIEVMAELRNTGRDPLLLVTGGPVEGNASSERYADFLRQTVGEDLQRHVVFVSDYLPVRDDTLRDLYLLADCLFYPSQREGFGLPVIEAARFRLPIWCQDIPAYEAVAEEGAAYLLSDLSHLAGAVEWLEEQPTFRQQRRCRRLFDPGTIYRDYYEPLLEACGLAATS